MEVITEIRHRNIALKLKYDGSNGDHGILPKNEDWFGQAYGSEYMKAIWDIKKALDPKNLLNPERLGV